MKKLIRSAKNFLITILGVSWIAHGLTAVIQDHLIDFTAFYGAAKNILVGLTPYGSYETFSGGSTFLSPFWVGWFFIPFTILPINRAFIFFGICNLLLSLVCLILILKWQTIKVSLVEFIYLLGCTFVLSFLTVQFGQLTIIQLFAAVVIISALEADRPIIAGLAIPLVIIKPHLILLFLIAAIRRGGRKMLLAGIGSTMIVMFISFLIQPSWITDMLQTVIFGQITSVMPWNGYVTLGGLFFLPPSFSLAAWPIFILVYVFIDNRFHSMPNNIWLPISLVLSLATAPYAFAYDLPLLLPVLIWSCLPLKPMSIIVILSVALITIFSSFSCFAYVVVLIIAAYSIRGAIIQMRLQNDLISS